jgi:hypothetical protein
MNDADRQHRLDQQAVAEPVDRHTDMLEDLLGRYARGYNREPVRRILESLAIEVRHLHDHLTPLDQPRVALEDNRAIDGDERAPTRPLGYRKVTDIGTRGRR